MSSARANGPSFVCIGAQKAGTTWLYDNLYGHPQLWLPPVKELHFFNQLCPNEQLLGREADRMPRGLAKLTPLRQHPSVETLKWLANYYSNRRGVAWYKRLFDPYLKGRQGVDITPAYSTMDERGVKFTNEVLRRDCQILLILRNPTERLWSAVKMNERWRQADISQRDIDYLISEISSPHQRLRTDYPRMIGLWRKYFGGRFHVLLYDQLRDAPKQFLSSVHEMIGVDQWCAEGRLHERSNSDRKYIAMPQALRSRIDAFYAEEIRALEKMVPDVSDAWLNV